MKKLMPFVSGVLSLSMSAVYADSPNSAVVLKDADHPVGCHASFPPLPPLFTDDEIHTTSTKSGNTTLTCHFNIPAGYEPDKAIKSTGFGCGIFLPDEDVFTNDTSFIANPGNRATLKCQVKLP